jgi:hypothetical protein
LFFFFSSVHSLLVNLPSTSSVFDLPSEPSYLTLL